MNFENDLLEYDTFIKTIIKNIPDIIKSIEIKEVFTKSGYRDLVTKADRGIEEYLTKEILGHFPQHSILGEETYSAERNYELKNLWVIDPIDGTTNFVKQRDDFATMITYFHDGKPLLAYIYEIKKDNLYSAISGQGVFLNGHRLEKPNELRLKDALISMDIRRFSRFYPSLFRDLVEEAFGIRGYGSAAIDGIRVMTGRTGAYLNYTGGPWDYAPFLLISKELGLKLMQFNGEDMDFDGYKGFIFAEPGVYEDIIRIIKNNHDVEF